MNAPDWLSVVAAAQAAGADHWIEEDVVVRRVRGGHNNALFQVEAAGLRFACKLCVPDRRRRAAREYDALRALQALEADLAPEPLWLDESCSMLPFPTIVYGWLPGVVLAPPVSERGLAAFLDSLQRLHQIRSDAIDVPLRDAWFHWFAWEPYLTELEAWQNGYGAWLAVTDPEGASLRGRLQRLVDQCAERVTTADVYLSREVVPLRICRVDQNLDNAVQGPDGRVRWVDWEYSGWGDPAMDLAELRWHAALTGLSDEQHRWLRQSYRPPCHDAAFENRLRAWDAIIVTRWAFLMLRYLSSLLDAPDRLRLSQPAAEPTQVRARFVAFLERAEQFFNNRPSRS